MQRVSGFWLTLEPALEATQTNAGELRPEPQITLAVLSKMSPNPAKS
jgi:hypothetical protein